MAVASGTSADVRAREMGSVRTRASAMPRRFARTPSIARAPSASTRASSAASNTARAVASAGDKRAWSGAL